MLDHARPDLDQGLADGRELALRKWARLGDRGDTRSAAASRRRSILVTDMSAALRNQSNDVFVPLLQRLAHIGLIFRTIVDPCNASAMAADVI